MYTFTVINILNSIGSGLIASILMLLSIHMGIRMCSLDCRHELVDKEHKIIICISAIAGIGIFLMSL